MFSGVTIRGLLLGFYGTVVHDDDEPYGVAARRAATAHQTWTVPDLRPLRDLVRAQT